ncbi:endonuclease/exonuclease/phosphatase family protein [Acidihalobacter prosperus]|uniref:Endonuclease n=1 Tax=Acidihalobacter prosperus TaxID=160660 RepID=A0A1A6C3R3_9GAMM|nr:endonuclease/exonuclease/phosphatase family protein [Acidihalobacter prosperus]OBS09201.1 endonuclease [Acidihalobacter prosperus]
MTDTGMVNSAHASPHPSRQLIRLLSYNIQVGITTSRYRHYLTHSWKHVLPYPERMATLRSIARFIADFDLVGLQEIDAGSLRTGFVDQAEFLANKAMFPHWYSQTNRRLGHFARHALGLMGRFSAHRVIAHRLPGPIPGRGALEVHFGSVHEPLVIILVHLSLGRRTRRLQLEYVARLANPHRHVVVMGDLNCAPEAGELLALTQNTDLRIAEHGVATYPSWRPVQSFDHILASPSLEVRESRAYPVNYSDHLPVGLELTLPAGLNLYDDDAAPLGRVLEH